MTNWPAAFALIVLIGGFLIWISAFAVLYAVFSTGCAFGWHQQEWAGVSLLRAVLVAILALHVAAHFGLYLWTRRSYRPSAAEDAENFMQKASVALALAGLLATLFTFAPVVALRVCV